MTERKIAFKSDGGLLLEGLLHQGAAGRGVVITHPHPLFGGDMYNIVVETIQRAYQEKGYSTLRFNFRGVGKSSGRYDDGNGEQADLEAAFNYLKAEKSAAIDLAGYSFGAWVIAQAAGDLPADSVIMVSPPAAMMKFDPAAKIPGLKLVITGSGDEFAPPDLVKNLIRVWNPQAVFEVIQGADHFYFGHTEKLEKILQKRHGNVLLQT
jgi:uncharacterized protein